MGHKYVKENETFNTDRNGTVPKPTASDVSNNKVLRADGSWVPQSGGGGGGSSSLSGLDDVSINSPEDGEFLRYFSENQRWGNHSISLNDLSDIALSSLSNGQILQWDANSQKFINVGKVNINSLKTPQDSDSGERFVSKFVGNNNSSSSATYKFCTFTGGYEDICGLMISRQNVAACQFRVNGNIQSEVSRMSTIGGDSGKSPSWSYNSSTHVLSVSLPSWAYTWFIGVTKGTTLL